MRKCARHQQVLVRGMEMSKGGQMTFPLGIMLATLLEDKEAAYHHLQEIRLLGLAEILGAIRTAAPTIPAKRTGPTGADTEPQAHLLSSGEATTELR